MEASAKNKEKAERKKREKAEKEAKKAKNRAEREAAAAKKAAALSGVGAAFLSYHVLGPRVVRAYNIIVHDEL